MGLIKWIKNFCWHDWYYKIRRSGYSVCLGLGDPESDFPSHMRGVIFNKYYKRVCLKCGKCEDTYTKAYQKRYDYVNKRSEIGEKIWEDSCLKS